MKFNTIKEREKSLLIITMVCWITGIISIFLFMMLNKSGTATVVGVILAGLPFVIFSYFADGITEANADDIVDVISKAEEKGVDLGDLKQQAKDALAKGDSPKQLWELYRKIEIHTDAVTGDMRAKRFDAQQRKDRRLAYKEALQKIN